MNANGHTASLVAAHPDNANAARHGLYSRSGRVLAARAEEIAAALTTLPHVQTLDVLAAEEIGSVLAALEAIDADLAERGTTKRGVARKGLLEHKARLSRELRAWVRAFGATPKARYEFAAALGGTVSALRSAAGSPR